MKKTIYDFEKKYEVQDDLLNERALEGLDERTLHETIKAMLINTIKDCIKYENWMDPDMAEISQFIAKENKTEEEIRKIKNTQDRLRNSLHFAKISENSLYTLLYQMLSSDVIKHAFKQDIPAIYENLYYMVDMESEITESITFAFAELYEAPSYKVMCATINSTIEDFNPNLKIGGVLLTLVDKRTNLSRDVRNTLDDNYGQFVKIYNTEIPKAINTAKSTSTGKSIFEFDKNSPVAEAYKNLAKEVLDNERTRTKNETSKVR